MNQRIKQILFDQKREYEWLIIAQSYFQCALINARILNKKLSEFAITESSPLEYCLKEIYRDYPQSPEYLIFPIIFNFKHGIEIYLKSIIGVQNSEFPKDHNLLNLLEEADIKDKKIEYIIRKYAFAHLLLPSNERNDTENWFERYPQGSPYDNLELFPVINRNGQTVDIPSNTTLEDFMKLMRQNNADIKGVINQEKINQLIDDVEFFYKNIG